MEGDITIDLNEYDHLCDESLKLQALLEAGVEEWEKYHVAELIYNTWMKDAKNLLDET